MGISSWTGLTPGRPGSGGGSTSTLPKIVNDIAERDELSVPKGQQVLVLDATGDSTVTSGSATYIWNDEWIKLSESESMDVVLQWANIINKPTEFPPQSHTHSIANVTGLETELVSKWGSAGNANTNPNVDFLGTTDTKALVFKTNNTRRMVIGANGNIGVNLSTDVPGQLFHLGDGNILLEGGGETAILFKRGEVIDGNTTYGTTHPSAPFPNPIFQIGRIIKGGDGAPQFRWMYADDARPEVVVFELDSEGILSSVRKAGVRGSHFEAHSSGDSHPFFRLNSYPQMQLQMGNGGSDDTDIAVARVGTETGALQYGPPTAQVTAAEWSSAGFKVAVGGLIFPDNSVQTSALTKHIEVNTRTANYTLVLTDAGKYVRMNVVGANTLTVPKNSAVAFPVGTVIHLRQVGAGQTTVSPVDGDVTINTPESYSLRKQGSSASLIKVATDTWDLTGDLEAV